MLRLESLCNHHAWYVWTSRKFPLRWRKIRWLKAACQRYMLRYGSRHIKTQLYSKHHCPWVWNNPFQQAASLWRMVRLQMHGKAWTNFKWAWRQSRADQQWQRYSSVKTYHWYMRRKIQQDSPRFLNSNRHRSASHKRQMPPVWFLAVKAGISVFNG